MMDGVEVAARVIFLILHYIADPQKQAVSFSADLKISIRVSASNVNVLEESDKKTMRPAVLNLWKESTVGREWENLVLLIRVCSRRRYMSMHSVVELAALFSS